MIGRLRINTRKIPIKLVANHCNWIQLDYDLLGAFDIPRWLRKLDELTNTNNKTISFGVYRLKLSDIILLKLMLQFICEPKSVESIQLANEPPRTYTTEKKLQILKENHDIT